MSSQTIWVVFEDDQGREGRAGVVQDEGEAQRWVQALVADQETHPGFYRHLACPSYEMRNRRFTSISKWPDWMSPRFDSGANTPGEPQGSTVSRKASSNGALPTTKPNHDRSSDGKACSEQR